MIPTSFGKSSPSSPATPSLASVNSTPVLGSQPARRASHAGPSIALAAQERQLESDPKWRKFSSTIEKTLQSFEQVNEWADFITFLAKLLKSLQGYPQFQLIPHKLTVAKRLSQCLNPALPTGVHQRALDVYTHILTAIGAENLRRDLPAWSSGLFPFFQYAATSVKPIVLGIYERFYLPLQESLRPATKAFILALLPGLEEETGEFFEKVAALLDRVSGTVSPSFFFQNMWLVLITAPNSRIPALNYLARRLPKMESEDSQSSTGVAHIAGEDIGLMIRGFAAALEDSQILVQRGILDLLTTTLKIDSQAFKATRWADQILLMRAVTGVVLRRDLSLSRRLYSWLLGPSDNSDVQIAYLKEHSLELLRVALKAEMDEQSTESVDRQRPFKIFISLLDKWEIGHSLTEVLVLDAFAALQVSLRPDDHDELLMTANMLFEILDPFLMWRQIYQSIRASVEDPDAPDATKLIRFIIQTFRLHDEEVQKLHAPLVAFGMLDLVEQASATETPFGAYAHLTATLSLARELLEEIPAKFFESTEPSTELPPSHLGRALADTLYAAEDMKAASLPEMDGRELLTAGFATALRLAETCAKQVTDRQAGTGDEAGLLLGTLEIVGVLSTATSHSAELLALKWEAQDWTDSLLACLEAGSATVSSFALHSAIIKSILTLSKTPALHPPITRNRRRLVEALTSKLLEYLEPSCAPSFVEAVQLLWGVQSMSDRRHVESMISERLSSADPAVRLPAFEAFGNLWRFTEDSQLPGVVLRMPMFKMLDSLKSDDLSTRRAGEAWMRCSLKSYLRILDPLLFTLLDPQIMPQAEMIKVAGVRLPILVYRHTFDQARVHHVLDDLLSLARFGGQGFIRIAKGSFLKHSLDPAFRDRVRASELETSTYLAGLISLLVTFLRSEPAEEMVPSLGPINLQIHSIVAELLQVVISRGEAEIDGLQLIESALTARLYLCIHRNEIDLQNKLLHVLHSVIHAVSGLARRQAASTAAAKSPGGGGGVNGAAAPVGNEMNEAQAPDLTHDGMFVKIVSDAVSTQHNNALIHHWVDFLLMTIPQFRQSIHSVLFPLVDCLVIRLNSFVAELDHTYLPPSPDRANEFAPSASAYQTEATDAEYTVLMNALERLLLMAVNESLALTADDEAGHKLVERAVPDTASTGTGGLLGYMSGVLGSAEVDTTELSEETKTKHAALSRLRDAVSLLLRSWDVTSAIELQAGGEDLAASSQGYFASRAKLRARKALERVYKSAPTDTLEDLMAYWQTIKGDSGEEDRVFGMVDILAPSAQTVVSTITDRLKANASIDKTRSPYAASDELLFAFLECYLDRLDGPLAVQVWAVTLGFVRELLGNLSTSRPLIFSALRAFTVLSEKVSQTSALEDRRMRRDLQETFIRLVDASIQVAGRSVEQGGWLRRHAHLPRDGPNGDSESIRSVDKASKAETVGDEDDEKRPATAAGPTNQAVEITDFLAARVLADLRRFMIDPDKVVAVCSNMVYYIVAPAFKTRSKTFEVDPSVFSLLNGMVQNPQAVKAWRTQVGDAFADNRFFNAPPAINPSWKPLIQALMATDKERFVELTAKISTVSSANIFTNRELESLSRALSLRRLTYTLFTGDKNRFLTQLPTIQEKVVDLLRSPVGDMVHAEVYLCLRVLFCRIETHHLAGLWPVILTELLRLFESLVDRAVPDGSDLLHLVLSACKFLDLTLVLQTEEFQIHEWMFVTDTVDAIYPPDHWSPQAIMDRIGEVLSNSALAKAHHHQIALLSPQADSFAQAGQTPGSGSGSGPGAGAGAVAGARGSPKAGGGELFESPNPAEPMSEKRVGPRRPLLRSRRVHSVADLEGFFSTVSLRAYEQVYDGGGRVDWPAVEGCLERDLFSG